MSDEEQPNFVTSERFDRALEKASEWHRDQGRKGSGTPYVGHLLTVAGYVLEDGGEEDEAIAALLHDVLEDQSSKVSPEEIRDRFGGRVFTIVDACSQDNLHGEKDSGSERPPWRKRKQRYIDHMAGVREKRPDAATEILRVSLADKLANLRSILRDHREEGQKLWERFGASSPAEVLWYYGSLADVYEAGRPGPLASEFRHEVERLRAIAA